MGVRQVHSRTLFFVENEGRSYQQNFFTLKQKAGDELSHFAARLLEARTHANQEQENCIQDNALKDVSATGFHDPSKHDYIRGVIQAEKHSKSFQELIARIQQLIVTIPHCSRSNPPRQKLFVEDVKRKPITLKTNAGSFILN